MLIFWPMFQFGCFNACFLVTFINSSLFLPLNGPPEAVNISLFTSFLFSPFKHWNIAECSLSTGSIFTLFSSAAFITISPAVTSVSLFANAISFLCSIAFIVGISPIIPTKAVKTISTSSIVDIFTKPSIESNISISISFGIIPFNFSALSFS